MAMRSKKPCAKMGCCGLAIPPNIYCDNHKELEEQRLNVRKENYKRYNKERSDTLEVQFYHSVAWRKTQRLAMQRDHYLCQHCLKKQKIIVADMVHHIVPIKVKWELRLQLDNLISLCNECHNGIDHK